MHVKQTQTTPLTETKIVLEQTETWCTLHTVNEEPQHTTATSIKQRGSKIWHYKSKTNNHVDIFIFITCHNHAMSQNQKRYLPYSTMWSESRLIEGYRFLGCFIVLLGKWFLKFLNASTKCHLHLLDFKINGPRHTAFLSTPLHKPQSLSRLITH